MRGGAIPVLIWGGLLIVLAVINVVWTSDAIQAATFAFAVITVLAWALALVVAQRGAIRRGPPETPAGPEAVPATSLGAALAGFSVATFMFGFAFGRFLLFFGAGLFVASLGRLTVELRAQRRSREDVATRTQA
ncbi:MAG TPA: hypothetical protein VFN55_05290 [Solirubrobacteraceae bacterium]|nr:hypothetical protein [Solirubrobacteraceae bacterium]